MHLNRDRQKCGDVDRNSLSMVDWRMRPTRRQHALVIMVECIAENIKEVHAHRPPHPAACVAVGSPACPCQKLNQPQRPDCSGRHRRTERAAEWTHAPAWASGSRASMFDEAAESGTLLFLPVQSPCGTGLTPGGERLLFCPRTSRHAARRSYR